MSRAVAFRQDDRLIERIVEAGFPNPRGRSDVIEASRDESSESADLEFSSYSGNESGQWLLSRLKERTGEWSDRDGMIAEVSCIWFHEGVAHKFSSEAEWLFDFDAEVKRVIDEAEVVESDNRRLRQEERVKQSYECARAMAHEPRFVEAKSAEKRRFMAEQLFPDQDSGICREIAERAALVYWWEVAPGERTTQKQKIQELYEGGESISNIAVMLRTSFPKVKAVVAELDAD